MVSRPGQCESDDLLGCGAVLGQAPGELVGSGVQFGERPVHRARDDGCGVRGRGGLGFEEGRDGGGFGRERGGVPGLQQGVAGLRGEDVEVGDQLGRVLGDRFEDPYQGGGEPFWVVDAVGVVLGGQGEAFAGFDRPGERVMGGVLVVQDGDARAPLGGEAGIRIGLEDQQRVEEVAEARLALDVGQAEVVVLDQLGLLPLEAGEQVGHRLPFPEGDPDGNGCDEEADHLLDAGQVRRASGGGRAENDVVATGQAGEHHRPGGLDDRVEGEAMSTGQGGQRVRELRRERPGEGLRNPRMGGAGVRENRFKGSRVTGSRVAGSRVAGSRVGGHQASGTRVATRKVGGAVQSL